jgi:hypothetical protein
MPVVFIVMMIRTGEFEYEIDSCWSTKELAIRYLESLGFWRKFSGRGPYAPVWTLERLELDSDVDAVIVPAQIDMGGSFDLTM